ncbi:ABC transporter permease [bacterium]|nr:ABC transporter permease [bacterium]
MKAIRVARITRMGIKSLRQHKARASLTVLGIIFGVCSVVAMLSVGEGASQEIQEQLRRLGSDNILIKGVKLPEEQLSGGQSQGARMATYGLTYDDLRRFPQFLPHLKASTPLKLVNYEVRFLDRKTDTEVVATVPWYPQVSNHRMLTGRFFTRMDMDAGAPVCVIGARLARSLFAAHDPIGKNLRIDSEVYRVIGIMGDVYSTPDFENKPLWFVGENQNVYIPLTTYRQRNGDTFVKFGSGSATFEKVELHQVILTIDNQDNVMASSEGVRDMLASQHKRKDYEIVVPLQLIRQTQETRRLFNIVLGSIAAISLVVGGIGIMNIMLATVSERTREIGIRRALGARRRDIVVQFLVETLILSIAGGCIGLLVGAAIPKIITLFTDVKTVLTAFSFIIAFSVSVAVGLVFGIYPARRAAQMDPIEALRHE